MTSILDTDFIEKLLHDKTLLFLSVDIMGSTQFKNRNKHDWFTHITRFHVEFPSLLKDFFESNKSSILKKKQVKKNYDNISTPKFWKALGDELVFSVEIENYRHAIFFV